MQAIIASTSTLHGSHYLEYLLPSLKLHFKDINEILFIPFARPGGMSHQDYTKLAAAGLKSCIPNVVGIHETEDMQQSILEAKAIFVGGGNTFLLVKQLHELNLMSALKTSIRKGAKYLGTSAGSNICGKSMQTTNDMPIVQPPSYETLGLLNFNINPHYLDVDSTSKHKGESRETRIKEFQVFNTEVVVGLREGSWIKINNSEISLEGTLPAVIFEPNKQVYELKSGSFLKF